MRSCLASGALDSLSGCKNKKKGGGTTLVFKGGSEGLPPRLVSNSIYNLVSELKFARKPMLLFSLACPLFLLLFLLLGDFLQSAPVICCLGTVDVDHVVVSFPSGDLERPGVCSHEFVFS